MNTTMSTDDQPLTRDEIVAWVNVHDEKQRKLADLLDDLVSAHWHASCMDGEADMVWDLIVWHAAHPAEPARSSYERDLIVAVTALIRELGGTWGGTGCLRDAGRTLAALANLPEDEYSSADDGWVEPPTWYTVEEMAARTAQAMPGA